MTMCRYGQLNHFKYNITTDKQFDIKDLKANLEKDWNILITDEVVDEKIIRFIYNDYVITIEHHLDNLD